MRDHKGVNENVRKVCGVYRRLSKPAATLAKRLCPRPYGAALCFAKLSFSLFLGS